MVIYDTKNNNYGRTKGQLYLSVMDIDYLVSKYGFNKLSTLIHKDYVDCFKDELDKIKEVDKLSIQYYSSLSLGIETIDDERILDIIQVEVQEKNLFTKKELSMMDDELLEQNIFEIKNLFSNFENLPYEYLYKLRSYKMAQFIISNLILIERVEHNINFVESKDKRSHLNKEIKIRYNNLINLGLSSEIFESDYFDVKSKKYTK